MSIILLGVTVAHAATPQPSATPPRITFTPAQAALASVYTPRPDYPSRARALHIRGRGIFRLLVSLQTGLVKSLAIEHSTGSEILDTAAMKTLRQWRFKPEVLRGYVDPHHRGDRVIVRVPVTYSM
jgi:periplasmic protein TonB